MFLAFKSISNLNRSASSPVADVEEKPRSSQPIIPTYNEGPKFHKAPCYNDGHITGNPADCASFLICSGGKYIAMHCRYGLSWDSLTDTCNSIEYSQCNIDIPKPVPAPAPAPILNVQAPPPQAPPIQTPPFGEPYPNDPYGTPLAQPFGSPPYSGPPQGGPPVGGPPPYGGPPPESGPPPYGGPGGGGPPPYGGPEPYGPPELLIAPPPIAPPLPIGPQFEGGLCPRDNLLIANAADCTSYLICNHGKLIARPCGPGLYWDQNINTCNNIEDTQCQFDIGKRKRNIG